MPVATAVIAHDLVLGYGASVALDRSTFDVPAGKVTAIIGPNGAGKSTLLNAIAGLVDPIAGTLEVPARNAGNERVAYVLQSTRVSEALPISVREVVTMGRFAGYGWFGGLDRADRDAVESAMGRTGISNLATRHLQELSGGQRQRVFVAQGLAQDHDLLLLDEPLTGIDLPTAQAIDRVIHSEIERGCSVMMTTHDLSEAQIADHVLLLSGRVVAHGKPDEVLTAKNLSAAYGPSLLHLEKGTMFIDDPAHKPVPGRHVHRERSIHTEADPGKLHND